MKTIPFYIFISFALCLVCSSCDKKLVDGEEEEEESTLKPLWDWQNYERSDVLELGVKRVSMQPKLSVEIKANSSGKLTLLTAGQTSQVKADFMFALMDRKNLDIEKEKNDITEREEKIANQREIEFERPQRQKEARERLKEARLHLQRVEAILKSKTLKREASALFGPDYADLGELSLVEAGEELELAERQFLMAEENEPRSFEDKQRLSEIARDEREKAYDEKKEKSEFFTPFKGELRIELEDYLDDEAEYLVTSRQLIATMNDYQEMHAYLSVLGESWVSLDPSTLYIKLSDKESTIVDFKEEKVVKNKATKREQKAYIFAIETSLAESLKRLSGTDIEAALYTKLGERCWIVPKVDIALEALSKSDSKPWPDIVDDVWMGAKVIAEGENSLAISYDPVNTAVVNSKKTEPTEEK